MQKYDVIICGAGIIGLSIALELKTKNPNMKVLVIEKETGVGSHASGRNSGVLHAGFYYSPDSLKAKFCREGNAEMKKFCERQRIPIQNCGKVVVSRNRNEDERLRLLYEKGKENGVPLQLLKASKLSSYEPLAKSNDFFLWSPSTAVVDPQSVVGALFDECRRKEIEFVFDFARFELISQDTLVIGDNSYRFGHFINAAGTSAVKIANIFNIKHEFEILPFLGKYIIANNTELKLKTLVYPVPLDSNPFLGVHFTLGPSNEIKIGPTALLALGREKYSFFDGNLDFSESVKILKTFSEYYAFNFNNTSALLFSELRNIKKSSLLREAAKLVPNVENVQNWRWKKPGIRAQLYNKNTHDFESDFVIKRGEKSTHLLNIVSPGWTSSLTFSRWLVKNEIL